MFGDSLTDTRLDFPSTWKRVKCAGRGSVGHPGAGSCSLFFADRMVATSSSQTAEIGTASVACQSQETSAVETQTDAEAPPRFELADDTSPALMSFLRQAVATMEAALRDNTQSRAFDGFAAHWEDSAAETGLLHTLAHAPAVQNLQGTGVTWSSTGAVVAVAYGRLDHDNWCTHKSLLCTVCNDTFCVSRRKGR